MDGRDLRKVGRDKKVMCRCCYLGKTWCIGTRDYTMCTMIFFRLVPLHGESDEGRSECRGVVNAGGKDGVETGSSSNQRQQVPVCQSISKRCLI